MKEYIIDANLFSNYNEAYIVIREVISEGQEKELLSITDIVEKYLKNEKNFVVIWNNHKKSIKELGYNETVVFLKRKLQNVPLYEVVQTLKELKNAEQNIGKTMFDKILNAFNKNNIEVILK